MKPGALLLTAAAIWLWAHEGHKPLSAKGVDANEVAQGRLTVSRASLEALDVRRSSIGPYETLACVSRVAPWQGHAFASPRLSGQDQRRVR